MARVYASGNRALPKGFFTYHALKVDLYSVLPHVANNGYERVEEDATSSAGKSIYAMVSCLVYPEYGCHCGLVTKSRQTFTLHL